MRSRPASTRPRGVSADEASGRFDRNQSRRRGLGIRDCRPFTLVPWRHFGFVEAIVADLNRDAVPGALVECGVWRGGMVMWLMECEQRTCPGPLPARDVYLYDTFEGMVSPRHPNDGPVAVGTYRSITSGEVRRSYDEWHGEKRWAFGPIDDVRANVGRAGYPEERVHFVVGDVCETLRDPVHRPDSIALLRLDTDFYDSTSIELEVLYPRVAKGGVVILDDYYDWRGSRIATDEFLEGRESEIERLDEVASGGKLAFRKLVAPG